MRRTIVAVFLLLLLLVPVHAAPPTLDAQGAALSDFLRGAVVRGDVPGVVVMVVGRDRVLYHEAFGKLNAARGVDLQRDAIFRIASMTKPITSVAVMMLVEEGKLRLDDEVATYLPQFKDRQVIMSVNADGSFETRPARRAITIRHLLSHTSGIGYAWSDPKLAVVQKKLGLLEADLPLLHDPGERWTYGASTRVLGDVVAKISGQPIDAALESRILAPLGMRETSFAVAKEKYSRVITIHQRTNGTLAEQPNPDPLPVTVRGDGGLYSTANDYARFLQMLLNGGAVGGKRLLSPASITLMTENQIGPIVVEQQPSADPARSKPYPLGAGRDKWGLGFQLAAPSTNAAARSAGSYSWAGINNTHFWVDPKREIGVIVLMQVLPFYDDNAIAVLRGVEQRVYAHLN